MRGRSRMLMMSRQLGTTAVGVHTIDVAEGSRRANVWHIPSGFSMLAVEMRQSTAWLLALGTVTTVRACAAGTAHALALLTPR